MFDYKIISIIIIFSTRYLKNISILFINNIAN